MKTIALLFTGMLLTATSQAQAQTYVRRGGNHDGGGQGVMMADGNVSIADRFRPVVDTVPFIANDAVKIDLAAVYPNVKREVARLSNLQDIYAERSEIQRRETGNGLAFKIFGEYRKYYLVKSLPKTRDCSVERDNSGLPAQASVEHIACTRGDVTLLLDDGSPLAFANLGVKNQADILVHEAYRTVSPLMETSRIETIVAGLSYARDIQDRQKAGERKAISNDEMAVLSALLKELAPQSIVINGEAREIVRNGGGLSFGTSNFNAGAFVGIGSYVVGNLEYVGCGVEIVESRVELPGYVGDSIGDDTKITNSDLKLLSLKLGNNVLISNSQSQNTRLVLGEKTKVENSQFGPYTITFGGYGVIQNSQIERRVMADLQVEIKNSKFLNLDEHWNPANNIEAPNNVFFRTMSMLINSKIDTAGDYEQGLSSTVYGLDLRVRPRGDNQWLRFSKIEIPAQSHLRGRKDPIVLFTTYSPMFASKISLVRQDVDLSRVNSVCKMGFDAGTKTEYGIAIGSLTLSEGMDLSNCEQNAKLRSFTKDPINGDFGTHLELLSQRAK